LDILIDPTDLTANSIIITNPMYTGATPYDIETFLGSVPDEPSSLPQFGDEQPFPGSIRLVRATDIERMSFLVNLPTSQFNCKSEPNLCNRYGQKNY